MKIDNSRVVKFRFIVQFLISATPNTLSRGEGDREAVGEERRAPKVSKKSDAVQKKQTYRPHSSSVKNQRFLPPSPRGKAYRGANNNLEQNDKLEFNEVSRMQKVLSHTTEIAPFVLLDRLVRYGFHSLFLAHAIGDSLLSGGIYCLNGFYSFSVQFITMHGDQGQRPCQHGNQTK